MRAVAVMSSTTRDRPSSAATLSHVEDETFTHYLKVIDVQTLLYIGRDSDASTFQIFKTVKFHELEMLSDCIPIIDANSRALEVELTVSE